MSSSMDGRARSLYRNILFYLAAGLLPLVALAWHLDLVHQRMEVPFRFDGDFFPQNHFVKPLIDGENPMRTTRIAAPFGHNAFLWPQNATVDYALAAAIGRVTGSVGWGFNTAWFLKFTFASVLGAWALSMLSVSRPVAVLGGVVFSFLPFSLRSNVIHFNLSIYFIPVMIAAAVLMLRASFKDLPPVQRRLIYLCCVLLGLNDPYMAFFSCFLFFCVTLASLLFNRSWRSLQGPVLVIVLICVVAVINQIPSLIAFDQNPTTESYVFKSRSSNSEVNAFGLYIRDLVLPVSEHPIPQFRTARSKVFEVTNIPGMKSSVWMEESALGMYGAIGLIVLLMNVLFLGAARNSNSKWTEVGNALASCSALTMAFLVLGSIGGFSNFVAFFFGFIRFYNRVCVFIGFMGIFATSLVLDRMLNRFVPRSGPARFLSIPICAAIGVLALVDQMGVSGFSANSWKKYWTPYDEVSHLVQRIEDTLSEKAMVYQMPFPFKKFDTKVDYDEPYKAWVLSHDIRWSYAWVVGTDSATSWHRWVGKVSEDSLPPLLLLAGYDGVWIDRRAYPDRGVAAEQMFMKLSGAQKIESDNQTYVFIDISQPRAQLIARLGEAAYSEAQKRIFNKDISYLPSVAQALGG